MITARVAILERPRELVFRSEQLDSRSLQGRELLCETLVSAISPGTEVAAYEGAPPIRPGVTYPRLVGYCNVARVLACGSEASEYHVGDRILSFSSHRSHFLINADNVLAVLANNTRSEDAACSYLFHLGYSAILKADVRLGYTVVVLGLGVLGLGSVAMARLAGARVFGISEHARPRECALAMGAVASFRRSELPQLMAAVGSDRAHVVISTTNAWDDWRIALECAGNQGSIAVLGFPGRTEPQIPLNPFDSQHFYARQLRILAAGMCPERPDGRGFLPFNERDNVRRILGWIDEGSLRPKLLVSGEFAGANLEKAYESLLRRDGSPITYLLRWNGQSHESL